MNNQVNGAGERLEDAFKLFNQYSEKLADSYSDLESQIVQLTKELAEACSERLIQLAEKEALAKSLAVVNATVNRYGGNVNIVSTQGVGSEINITFPSVEVDTMLSSNLPRQDSNIKYLNSHTAFKQHSKKTKLKLIDCREI